MANTGQNWSGCVSTRSPFAIDKEVKADSSERNSSERIGRLDLQKSRLPSTNEAVAKWVIKLAFTLLFWNNINVLIQKRVSGCQEESWLKVL